MRASGRSLLALILAGAAWAGVGAWAQTWARIIKARNITAE